MAAYTRHPRPGATQQTVSSCTIDCIEIRSVFLAKPSQFASLMITRNQMSITKLASGDTVLVAVMTWILAPVLRVMTNGP